MWEQNGMAFDNRDRIHNLIHLFDNANFKVGIQEQIGFGWC